MAVVNYPSNERTDAARAEARRIRQIKKHAGERCAVCGKYGAHEEFEPIRALTLFAKSRALTLALPDSKATHPKCLTKLKAMVSQKCRDECSPP
jgi:hypothetical protein